MNSENLEKEIIQYIELDTGTYVKIKTSTDIVNIHNLIFKGINDDSNNNDIINLYYGYYCYKQKDYPQMLKYYLLAAEQHNPDAMYNLGRYYYLQKDYTLMLEYWLLAINYGHSRTMKDLGRYYQQQGNYELMLKYYLLAIEQHNPIAMNNLGAYYQQQKDYKSMLKYYLLAIEEHSCEAMSNLGSYYEQQGDYESMLKYYFLNLKHGGLHNVYNIISYCQEHGAIDVFVQLYTEFSHIIWISPKSKIQLTQIISKFLAKGLISADLIKIIIDIDINDCDNIDPLFRFVKQILAEKIDLIDLHFNYSPNATGCIEAKNDFINRLL